MGVRDALHDVTRKLKIVKIHTIDDDLPVDGLMRVAIIQEAPESIPSKDLVVIAPKYQRQVEVYVNNLAVPTDSVVEQFNRETDKALNELAVDAALADLRIGDDYMRNADKAIHTIKAHIAPDA